MTEANYDQIKGAEGDNEAIQRFCYWAGRTVLEEIPSDYFDKDIDPIQPKFGA